MSGIVGNLNYLKSRIPASVKLIAVSKTRPVTDIVEAYNSGQRRFGENRVQEILDKKDLLPNDVEWHLIGHLQTNKVKIIVPFITMIQSIDSLKLLSIVNSEAFKINRVVDCLLQIHIAHEETKFGFNLKELSDVIESPGFKILNNVRLCGVMGMATYTSDMNQVRREFVNLSECFKILKDKYFIGKIHFNEISMGMSGDYEIAIEEGSTMIRVGSLIFGERN